MVCDSTGLRTFSVGQKSFSPPLFLAPMAGITHSAFRRLVSDFGGYGALYTEMLSGSALLNEKCGHTPFTLRREEEGKVVFQLLLTGFEDCGTVIERVAALNPSAIDLNLACPAPEIRKIHAGARLFMDQPRLRKVVQTVRAKWGGILTAKCRLGEDERGWEQPFVERIRLLEDAGVDALIVHPRFFKEKFKRTARWKFLPWITQKTRLPVIASGDICCLNSVLENQRYFKDVKGLMIGRMAVVKPWIFREFNHGAVIVDYAEVWERFFNYVLEDFADQKAIGRIKQFAAYFARNFFFGHQFFSGIQNASNLTDIQNHALAFLRKEPKTVVQPSVMGV